MTTLDIMTVVVISECISLRDSVQNVDFGAPAAVTAHSVNHLTWSPACARGTQTSAKRHAFSC